MKLHLSEIPESGWEGSLEIPLASMPRLVEAHGPQEGTCHCALLIRNREGNVHLKGSIRVDLRSPCQRCLDPVPLPMEEPLDVALVPAATYRAQAQDVHLGGGDLEVSFYEGEELDLASLVEEEILLFLPDVVTGEDEAGNCDYCGRPVEEMFAGEEDKSEGHPFAAMRDMLRES